MTNPKLFPILVILLISITPISYAEQNDPIHSSNNIDNSENDIEDLSNFDLSALNSIEEPLNPPEPSSISEAPISIGNTQGISSNILNKFSPKGSFYNNLFTGSAGYSYSIEVPPGVNGLAPSININYNSHQTALKGLLGNGWDLNSNHISRYTENTRSDTLDDSFYLNLGGTTMKLVYVPSEERYHTEHETYMYIEKDENSWLVKAKDGTKYRFGYTSDSRLDSVLESYTSLWYLDEIEDTHGNKITYEYIKNPSSDEAIYFTKIEYGANKILFFNSLNAQDKFNGYRYGTKIKSTALLNSILILNNDNLVRRYSFNYITLDHKKFLWLIRTQGSDGSSNLPFTEFSYYTNTKGWQQDNTWNIPSEAIFGDTTNQGVRLLDLNGDGYQDIIKMKDSSIMSYWINNKNGWGSKQTWNSPISTGLVDSNGNDQGVRFLDLNADTRTDLWQSMSGRSSLNEFLLNEGNNLEEETVSLPSGISFIEKTNSPVCTPNYCSYGYTDKGTSCNISTCTRTCEKQLCSNSGTIVLDGTSRYPKWNDNDYQEEDRGNRFSPQSNKCYKFEYTGSSSTDGDDSECYDLYTDGYDGDLDDDCTGRDIDAYAGIGFAGNRNSGTWLHTIPGGDDFGFIGNVDNSYWRYKYISEYDKDSGPDRTGSNEGDWDGFNREICDEAGTHTIYCGISYQSCIDWGKSRCGYGCVGEGTAPFIVLGVYADYNNNLWDALYDNEPACERSVMDDNDYSGYGTYRVTEYTTSTHNSNQECSFPPYEFKDTGVRLADVNSDGKTDLIKGTPSERRTWLRTDNGWQENNDWQMPSGSYFIKNDKSDNGIRILDVNGDGLIDIVKGRDNTRITWLNTGKGWSQDNTWTIPSGAEFVSNNQGRGVALIDIDGDSLPDIVLSNGVTRTTWLNTGNGWVQDNSWNIPTEINLKDNSAALADINGDGLPDIVKAPDTSNRKIWLNKYSKQYLLREIKNSLGGRTSLDYEKIASLDNTGNDNINDLGFNGWVVNTIENNNNISGTQNTISINNISYENGMFDSDEKQFAGFAYVEETRNQKTKIKHNFFQDKGKMGLEYETEILNNSNNLFKKVQNEYTSTSVNGYYINTLLWTINSLYDGSVETPSQTKIQFGYDNYGNIISTSYLGDTSKTGDEKYLYNEYLYNTNNWILDLPKHTYLLESDDSTKASETWYRYDNNEYNENPIRGDITSIEHWLGTGTNPIETYHYDTYGNILTYTNPLEHSTNYLYGSNNTFIIKETNAIGHETNYEYDKGTGNLLSQTDPNGFRTEYQYDVFGRKVKEILPYDSIDYPSIQIEYNLDGIAPEEIKVINREQSGTGNTFDLYFYYDGFWRLIQKKSESEQPELITSDIYYDKAGKIKQESNPYYSTAGYTIPNENINSITSTYDLLGRITHTNYPDGSAENIIYHNWSTLIYDKNSNIKEYESDAYDRTIKVKEHNNDGIYTTSYFYDDNDNLIKILDNQNNFIQYDYDSLGRKTRLDDMDLGIWSYTYDTIGNLITQTDNKGNIIHLTYDSLNRIAHKEFSEGDITYTYDINTLGTISSIQTPTLLRNFWYDNKLRKIREEKVIDRTSFDTLYSYDSMDRLTSKTLPNGEIINYEYNNQSLLESIPSIITNLDYNEMSQVSTRNYANNLDTQFEYNSYNYRLHELTTGNIQELEYSYDHLGNILQINDIVNNKISEFDYDNLYRLIHAQRPLDFDIHYIYDSIGNLLDISSEKLNATFHYSNSLAHTPIMVTDKSTPLFTIPLEKDWNLISIPLVLEDNTISEALLSLNGKYNTTLAYNSSEKSWDSYYPNQPFLNTINTITLEKGYWIEMIKNATLTLSGNLPTSTIYTLYTGWNLISYPSLTEQPVTSTLVNVNETFTTIFTFSNNSWKSYSPNKPSFLNSLQTMQPGHGYWVKANQNTTWQFNGTHYISN